MHSRKVFRFNNIDSYFGVSAVLFFIFVSLQFQAQWTEAVAFPGASRDDALALSSGSKSLFFGGNLNGAQGGERVYCYDWESNQWSEKSSFPGARRQYHGGFMIDSKGYVIGGYSETGEALKDFWCYDFRMDSWKQLPDFPGAARWSFASFAIADKAYIVGGTTEQDRLDEVWRFDAQTNQWTKLKDFPGGKRRENIGTSFGPFGYTGLGFDTFNEAGHYADWWRYDPRLDEWIRLADYPGGALSYAQAQSSTSGIWVGGGMDFNKVPTANAFLYNVYDKVWIPSDSIPSGATSGASSIFYQNKIGLLTGLNRSKIRETHLIIFKWTNRNTVDWLVYPNPAQENNLITLQGLPGQEVRVYNLQGKRITTFQVNDLGQAFIVLPSGVYWLSPPAPSNSKPIQLLVR